MHSGGSEEEPGVNPIFTYLCLGSNLGDRRGAIGWALNEIEKSGVTIAKRSAYYETEPVDYVNQPWFLNRVVSGTTSLPPERLLASLKDIEARAGRMPTVRFGPRRLDIDILLYGDEVITDGPLIVPHPRMDERRFVLIPLLEIAPDLVDPRDGRRFADILDGLDEGKKVFKSTQRGY